MNCFVSSFCKASITCKNMRKIAQVKEKLSLRAAAVQLPTTIADLMTLDLMIYDLMIL